MRTEDVMGEFLHERRTRARATLDQDEWAVRKLIVVCPVLPAAPADIADAPATKGLKEESRFDVWTCLRKFLRWVEERHGYPNPCSQMSPPPRPKTTRRVLDKKETRRLADAARTERDRLLVELPLSNGVRLKEIAYLTREDVKDRYIVVTGKHGTRTIPVLPGIRDRMHALVKSGPLWISQRKKNGHRQPLGRSGVQQVYKRLFERAEISQGKHGPHVLRHTFATWYIRKDGRVTHLQQIMGHEKLDTTMIYVTLAAKDVEEDYLIHSPLDDLVRPDVAEEEPECAIDVPPGSVALSTEDLQVGIVEGRVAFQTIARVNALVPPTPVVAAFDRAEDLDRFIRALQEQRERLRGGETTDGRWHVPEIDEPNDRGPKGHQPSRAEQRVGGVTGGERVHGRAQVERLRSRVGTVRHVWYPSSHHQGSLVRRRPVRRSGTGSRGMRALTLHQPWATLIALGHKRYETRSWRTAYRGPLLIHAGLRSERDFERMVRSEGWLEDYPDGSVPLGGFVAACRLAECVPADQADPGLQEQLFGDFGHGRWAWRLENLVCFPSPVPCAGKRGLWMPRRELVDLLHDRYSAQLNSIPGYSEFRPIS